MRTKWGCNKWLTEKAEAEAKAEVKVKVKEGKG